MGEVSDDYIVRWTNGVPVTQCARCGQIVWDVRLHESHMHSMPPTPITITWAENAAAEEQPQVRYSVGNVVGGEYVPVAFADGVPGEPVTFDIPDGEQPQ